MERSYEMGVRSLKLCYFFGCCFLSHGDSKVQKGKCLHFFTVSLFVALFVGFTVILFVEHLFVDQRYSNKLSKIFTLISFFKAA